MICRSVVAARRAPCQPPSGGIKKLPLACPADSRTTGVPARNPGIRSDIAPLSGGFAEEQRQERTCVRDWSGDDRKASGSKKPPSGGTNTTLPVVPEARQKAQQPATPESGAISRRYPVVLPRSSDRSVLAYVTGAATTARPAGASEIAPCYSEASRIISRNSSRESSERCLPFLASFSLNFIVVSVMRS